MCDGCSDDTKSTTSIALNVNYEDFEIQIDKIPVQQWEYVGDTISGQVAHDIEQLVEAIKTLMKNYPQVVSLKVERKQEQVIEPCTVNPHSVGHYRIVRCIAEAFESYFEDNNIPDECFTNSVPICSGLNSENEEPICPDIVVVNNPRIVKDDGIHGIPIFIAEVVSDQSRETDYKDRLELYRNIGVDEYWIVDRAKGIIIKYLKSEEYIPVYYGEPKMVEVSSYPGLVINVEDVMQG